MKKYLILLSLIFIFLNVNVKAQEIKCFFKNVDFSQDNITESDYNIFLELYFPFDFEVDLKYLNNNWSIETINYSFIKRIAKDLEELHSSSNLSQRNKLVLNFLSELGGVEADEIIKEFRSIPLNEFNKLIVDSLIKELEIVFINKFIEMDLKIITNQNVTEFQKKYILLKNENIVNKNILYSVHDNGRINRLKFLFPDIINNPNTDINMNILNTDNSIFIEANGVCKNINAKKSKQVVSTSANIDNETYCLNRGLRQRSLGTQFGKCPAGFKKISKEEFYSFPNLPIIDEKSEVAKSNTSQNTQESQVVVTSTKLDKKSLKEELQYWKELFQDELITQAEYDAKRKELLSGASVTTTTKVVEPKVEKKKVVVQKQETKNENTKTIDISFKSKNYISQSLQGSLGFFANDGKIKDYCEDKYPKLHVYMECYAQNLKKSKVYKKARNLYDIYIELGRHLAWEAVLGNVSDSSARYQLAAKRQEMNDAYTENSSKKWKNIANALDDIKARHYPTPPPAENSNKQTCDIIYFNGKADRMTCK